MTARKPIRDTSGRFAAPRMNWFQRLAAKLLTRIVERTR